jgi:hypothetical protein
VRLHCGRGTKSRRKTHDFEPGGGEAEKYRKNSIKIILA